MVITIIILIILATITINFAFGENGLITRAQWAQEQYQIEQVREKLEMAKGSAFADGKGSIDPDHYFDIIEDEGIIGSKENDVKDNEDGTYEVTTNEGYIFEITLVPTKENPEDIEIEYIGKGEATSPRISTIDVTGKTTNSISVKVEGKNLDGAEYTYYYKKSSEGEESWKEYIADKSSNTCTISGLETKVTYDIKVVVTTSKGTDNKEISEITGELAEGSITIENTEWQGDGTAKVRVTTDITEPGCYIEYKVGAEGNWTRIESGDEITLQLNDEVYVRVTDGTNVLKEAYRKIEDTTNPIISKVETSNITSDSITVTVTAEDNESGLATNGTYKYYLNDGEAIASTENSYTFTDLQAETSYTIKVEVFDKAGNMEDDSVTIMTDTTKIDGVAIPDGFYYVGGTKSEGIVISDNPADEGKGTSHTVAQNLIGNQFVWIPVENDSLFQRYDGYRDGDRDDDVSSGEAKEPYVNGYSTEVTEYNEMYQSVIDNNGFYVGRYEAGTTNSRRSSSSGISDTVYVKQGMYVYNWIGWSNSDDLDNQYGGAVELSKKFANTKGYTSVKSTLIYAIQWDAIMNFIDPAYATGSCSSTSFVKNSSGKGWYGQSAPTTTGSNANYAVNNVYDLGGNVWEWTMEMYGRQ